MTATGFAAEHLPDGAERDEILALLRVGLAFRAQQRGRRRGPLAREVARLVAELPPNRRTWPALLTELELAALRHRLLHVGVIEAVDRAEEVIKYRGPRGESLEAGFRRVRNLANLRGKKNLP